MKRAVIDKIGYVFPEYLDVFLYVAHDRNMDLVAAIRKKIDLVNRNAYTSISRFHEDDYGLFYEIWVHAAKKHQMCNELNDLRHRYPFNALELYASTSRGTVRDVAETLRKDE
jgi:hypothetical protein